jgi:hypothetical protein
LLEPTKEGAAGKKLFFFFFLQIGINEDDVSVDCHSSGREKIPEFLSGRGNKLKFEFYFFSHIRSSVGPRGIFHVADG